jgi:hypothetical protein
MVRTSMALGLAFVVVVVVGGYGFHWTWTGFPGNTLWDWLNLCLLPVTLSFIPFALEQHTGVLIRVGALAAVALAVLLVGGYGMGWSWTGFPGNTLWDWLHLLLLPVALPFVAHGVSERQKRSPTAGTGGDGEPRSEAAPRVSQPGLAAPTSVERTVAHAAPPTRP